jgi:hypothetical protein
MLLQPVSTIKEVAAKDSKSLLVMMKSFVKVEGAAYPKFGLP